MRVLYSLLIALSAPFVMFYFSLRGLREHQYMHRWAERFGFIQPGNNRGGVLLHAASIGEFNAAAPLIQALQTARPDLPITVTTLTPAGSGRILDVLGRSVFHVYLPLDLHNAVSRFLNRLQPRLVVILETEIWPNLFLQAERLKIPLIIVNARLSAVSSRRLQYLPGLIRRALQSVAWVGAQSAEDAKRLLACGTVPQFTQLVGNLKYDLQIALKPTDNVDELRSRWGPSRPVLVAGSTHKADERVVIPAFAELLKQQPATLLVLAPRHPGRFGRVANAARAAGLSVALHSEIENCSEQTQCLVIDAMGALLAYYNCADLVFIGGSVGSQGGHNVLEPAMLGKPVLVGRHTQNAANTVQALITCGGAVQIKNQLDFQLAAERILLDGDLRNRMGHAGKQLIEKNQGALKSTLNAIIKQLGD